MERNLIAWLRRRKSNLHLRGDFQLKRMIRTTLAQEMKWSTRKLSLMMIARDSVQLAQVRADLPTIPPNLQRNMKRINPFWIDVKSKLNMGKIPSVTKTI